MAQQIGERPNINAAMQFASRSGSKSGGVAGGSVGAATLAANHVPSRKNLEDVGGVVASALVATTRHTPASAQVQSIHNEQSEGRPVYVLPAKLSTHDAALLGSAADQKLTKALGLVREKLPADVCILGVSQGNVYYARHSDPKGKIQ